MFPIHFKYLLIEHLTNISLILSISRTNNQGSVKSNYSSCNANCGRIKDYRALVMQSASTCHGISQHFDMAGMSYHVFTACTWYRTYTFAYYSRTRHNIALESRHRLFFLFFFIYSFSFNVITNFVA